MITSRGKGRILESGVVFAGGGIGRIFVGGVFVPWRTIYQKFLLVEPGGSH